MRIRISTIASLMAATVAGLMLFQTSQNVQQAESRLRTTHDALGKEEDSMRVLETEWDYLNRPDRIEELTRQHLKMQSPPPGALVRDSAQAIAPPKAETFSMPAVLHPLKPADKTTLPMPSPVTNDSHRQFDDLLQTLTKDTTKDGGKP